MISVMCFFIEKCLLLKSDLLKHLDNDYVAMISCKYLGDQLIFFTISNILVHVLSTDEMCTLNLIILCTHYSKYAYILYALAIWQ